MSEFKSIAMILNLVDEIESDIRVESYIQHFNMVNHLNQVVDKLYSD